MKRLFFPLLTIFFAGTSFAEPIGRSDAQATAKSFLASRGVTMQADAPTFRAPRKSRAAATDEAYYYVFNAGNDRGYVIVSGDDRTERILGYVEEGTFDEATIPDNMRAWLQQYAAEIQSLDYNSPIVETVGRLKARRVTKTRHNVPPLVKSRWNQGDPYNVSCPIYYKEDGTTAQPASGCVATAFAQVINYYKFPEKTVAAIPSITNTYTLSNGTKKTVTARSIARGAKIDWENMCDRYTGGETEEQRKAVGDLMLYCGQSVGMGYGGSSGAVTSKCATSIVKYFGFDDQAHWVNRSDYDIADWTDMLYEEIASGHPLCYNGHSTGGGHAFVLDGYDGEGRFHVNWGWGGSSDGWYVVTSLNPGNTTAIGASSTADGYTIGQGCIMGVRYPDHIKEEPTTALTINDIKVSGPNITGTFINWTGGNYDFITGIVKYNEERQTYEVVGLTQNVTGLTPNTYKSLTFNINRRLKPGTYRLSPASRVTSNRTWRPQLDLKREYILATVDTLNVLTLQYVKPVRQLQCDTIILPTICVPGKEVTVNVNFTNLADEFFGEMSLFAGKDGTKEYQTSRSAVTVPKNGTGTVTFNFKPAETGTYDLWICNNEGTTDYGHTTVEVKATAGNVKLSVANIVINNASGTTVYGNRLQGTMSIKNSSTIPFNGRVKIQIWEQGENNSSTYWSSQSTTPTLSIAPSRSTSAQFTFTNLKYDRHYYIVAYYVEQDGTLDNGALWNSSHQYKLSPGLVYWKNTGALASMSAKSLLTTPTTAAGLYFDLGPTKLTRLSTNKQANTFYAFVSGMEVPTLNTTLDHVNIISGSEAEKIILDNVSPYYNPVNFTARKASLCYTFPETVNGSGWESLFMPFVPESITIDSVAYQLNDEANHFWIYDFAELDDFGTPVFLPASELLANTPYLIAADSTLAGKTVVFSASNVSFGKTGSEQYIVSSDAFKYYATTLQESLKGVYHLNETGTAYVYSATSTTIKPMTNYFTSLLPDEVRPDTILLPMVPHAVETAVRSVEADVAAGSLPVFNTKGQRVATTTASRSLHIDGLKPGIYVIQGKKVSVK